jgi:hypothetical protein
MRTRKWFVAIVAVCAFVIGYTAPSMGSSTHGPSRYKLADDMGSGMPFRVVLRHCAAAEDTLARLRLIDYEPGRRAAYRCVTP